MKCKGLLGTGLAVIACAVVATPPVLAVELSHPAAQYPTPRGLMADGLRWQGIADVYQLRQRSAAALGLQSSALPPARGLLADGLRWQGIAHVYQLRQRSAAALRLQSSALPPAQGLLADGLRWQAIARAYE